MRCTSLAARLAADMITVHTLCVPISPPLQAAQLDRTALVAFLGRLLHGLTALSAREPLLVQGLR